MKRLALIAALAWVIWRLKGGVQPPKEGPAMERERLMKIFRPLDFSELYPGYPRVEVKTLFEGDLRRMTQELASIDGIPRVEGEVRVDTHGDARILVGIISLKNPHFTFDANQAILELLEQGFMYHVESGKFVAGGEL